MKLPVKFQYFLLLGLGSLLGLSISVSEAKAQSLTPPEIISPTITTTVVLMDSNPTPASSSLLITLDELGYADATVESPYGQVEYTLSIPENWTLVEGSFVEFDLGYFYDYIGEAREQPAVTYFGKIVLTIDGVVRQSWPLQEASFDHRSFRVDLLPWAAEQRIHRLQIALDADQICRVPHIGQLKVYATSFFSLQYEEIPLITDLALYPRPFYQRTFEVDQVRFVLPEAATTAELSAAATVAAKLGRLTYRQLISGTTDVALQAQLAELGANQPYHEHLMVIGTPETNDIVRHLGTLGVLPVALRERQLTLRSWAPAGAAPGDQFTYTVALTNTTTTGGADLSLLIQLPDYITSVTCSPACAEISPALAHWPIANLAAGQVFSGQIMVQFSAAITNTTVENTVTLIDRNATPLNVSTVSTILSTPLSLSETGRVVFSTQGDYFFTYDNQAIPETLGIVQEIVSPWDPARAILLITGLDDHAVYKAGLAMSWGTHIPPLAGPFALIREVRAAEAATPLTQTAQLSFSEMGYEDRTLKDLTKPMDYFFELPANWQLTESAYLKLNFRYSQVLGDNEASLGILFNGAPLATLLLDVENVHENTLQVALPASLARPGERNRISLQVSTEVVDKCAHLDIWLLISKNSYVYLDHQVVDTSGVLLLDFYPHPFDLSPDLSNLAFVLPTAPTVAEWEHLLRLAAYLGTAADGPDLAPSVLVADTVSDTLSVERHLLVIGRPSRNALFQALNAYLPQSFKTGTDMIEQKLGQFVYYFPMGVSLGVVELLPSPWHASYAILAITGTTDEGIDWAMDVLTARPWLLRGNITFITEDAVKSLDTYALIRAEVVNQVSHVISEMVAITPVIAPVENATATTPLSPTLLPGTPTISPSGGDFSRPGWLIPLVIGMSLIVIAILAIAFWQWRRRLHRKV